jgi:CO/xanthine dehydrogenase FAD-binding subunit
VVLAGVGTVRGGEFAGLSLAAGSVAATVERLSRAQAAGEGRRADDPDVPLAVAGSAMQEVSPITDIRSTEDYRRAVVGRLMGRFIRDLAAGELPGVTG